MKPDRLRLISALSIVVLALVLGACHSSDDESSGDGIKNAAEAIEKALAPREVELVSADARRENPSVELVGEIRAFDVVRISSEVGGKVDRVHVEVGDRVARGAPLIEVDRETFAIYLAQSEANVEAATADLALAEKDLERKKDLQSDDTIPQATLDQAQAGFDLAKARLAAAQASRNLAQRNYERSVIRAPEAGDITERMVVAGQWADVGAGLLDLALSGKVKIAARVPESWVGRFSDLKSFSFTVGTSSAVRTAEIYSMQPMVREASRSFEIVGTAPNEGSMRPGMFANVKLTSPSVRNTLWLPASAVATSDLPQVLMVEDDHIVYRKVQIGRRDNGTIEIVAGLEEGEQVIRDVAGLTRGLPVKIVASS